ncbi:uncharacterized protein LOC144633310 isoform X2 [Oculina patagonica]
MQTTALLLLILGVGYSLAAESCSVSPNDRNDCGWYGIEQDTCEGRGCCYDDTDFGFETKWCFYPTDNKCYGIAAEEREECGYYGIQREECENDNGCCFDHTVPNVPWCFKGKEPAVPGEATVPPAEAGEATEPPTEERNDCGWIGITKDTCEGRGCCYDDSHMGAKFCFYPTDSKCYGIVPEKRKECGYFGIQRDECEKDRGCCFDHTVPNVPWCFIGRRPPTPLPTQGPTEGSGVGPTEEPTEELTTESITTESTTTESTEEPTTPSIEA